MPMLNVKQVNKQRQISICKKCADRKVRIDEYPDGTVVLEPAEIISEFEMKLFKSKTLFLPIAKTNKATQSTTSFPKD